MHEYVLTLLVAAAVTYLLTPLVRRLAVRFGVVQKTRDRDVHTIATPRMGGLAMYAGLAAGLLVASQMTWLGSAFVNTETAAGLLAAGGLIVVIGIIDDRWGLPAIAKLAGQVVAGDILVRSGVALTDFPGPHGVVYSLTYNESVVLTILVVVATINAVNFIDGLDGLAAGIVAIAAISFFLYYYYLARSAHIPAEAVPALVSVILVGVCVGFLPHNFHPARIFMGDTGSMLLGLLLAYVPISAISTLDFTAIAYAPHINRFGEILPLLVPAAVMVIPYTDMLRAVVRRTRAGQSPFAPDRLHLHHRMLDIGHSHRTSVLILYAWATLFSGTVVLMSIVGTPLMVLAGTTLAGALVLALLSLPSLRWWERNKEPEGVAPAVSVSAPAAISDVPPAAATDSAHVPAALQPAYVAPTAAPHPAHVAPDPALARSYQAAKSAGGDGTAGNGAGENGTGASRQPGGSWQPASAQSTASAHLANLDEGSDETLPFPVIRGSRASGSIIP